MSQSAINRTIQAASLGPLAAEVKSHTSKKTWQSLVARAKNAGFTVDSFLDSSTPRPLKERTDASLRAQATKTLTTAYQPAERELSIRERRIHALDDKRARDESYYTDWLTARHAELATHAAAADQSLLDAGRQIQSQTADNYAQNGIAATVQTAGGISNPTDSKALNIDVPAAAKHDIDMIANSRDLTAQIVGSHADAQSAQQENNMAFTASLAAKRQAETWQSLTGVADDRQKLRLQRGSDTAKELDSLRGQEISKAQRQQDNEIVKQRLQLQDKTIQERAKEAADALGLKRDALTETTSHHNDQEAIQRAANDIRQDNLDVAWFRAKHPNFGKKGAGGTKADKQHPQLQFDLAYSTLAGATRYDKKNNPHSYGTNQVQANKDKFIALVMKANKGITRPMANAVVTAYIRNGGVKGDPGVYTDWLLTPPIHYDKPAG